MPTARAFETMERISRALVTDGHNRAFTLTGVYGTGKSSCAHFLTAITAAAADPIRARALDIARSGNAVDGPLVRLWQERFPAAGFVRAVATGQREPLAHTVLRALSGGAERFWASARGRKPKVVQQVIDAATALADGNSPKPGQVVTWAQELAEAAGTGVLLVLDELGKNLEYAVHSPDRTDLYLLQQLAELPNGAGDSVVVLVGILHQSFAEYGQTLAAAQRKEWGKIQGRFEDIPFTDSTEQMLRLVGAAIVRDGADKKLVKRYEAAAGNWTTVLAEKFPDARWEAPLVAAVLPLHPLAARLLPELSTRYAQNDRSLFSFLTSDEPHSFAHFLTDTEMPADGKAALPLLRVDRLYDYFVESLGSGIAARPQYQRWLEVQSRVSDAADRDPDEVRLLKAIGVYNLVSSTGALRARWDLVILSLLDDPADDKARKHWDGLLRSLEKQGLVSYRKRADELRLWEGSDFDIQSELDTVLTEIHTVDSRLLESVYELRPHIAQRHSYETGTLRYFESRFAGTQAELEQMIARDETADGVVVYWIGREAPGKVPSATVNGRPLVLLIPSAVAHLWMAVREYVAIRRIERSAAQLQTDGVARKEVRERANHAERLLADAIAGAYDLRSPETEIWVQAAPQTATRSVRGLHVLLSDVCDKVYDKGLVLDNELLNRRKLTSQGAKARRLLLEAILDSAVLPRLGIEGFGPEYSMYASFLLRSGIHRQEDTGDWSIGPPSEPGVKRVWQAIEQQIEKAAGKPIGIDDLFARLMRPPYGVKEGPLPVLLAAVLAHRANDFSVFKDGSYLHTLGPEHFELLVKRPERFAVKHFRLEGIRGEVFRELESALRNSNDTAGKGSARNQTLLGIVAPLVRFAAKLPEFSKQARDEQRLSQRARRVRDVLLSAADPESLIFRQLPEACDLAPFDEDNLFNRDAAQAFRAAVVESLRELHGLYPALLAHCRQLLVDAFGVRLDASEVRDDLRIRASHLVEGCLDRRLRSFLLAAMAREGSDDDWLESLLLIVADKPATSWNESDIAAFEMNLADIARRFGDLEAIYKDLLTRRDAEGYDVKRVTITDPTGTETREVVWIDHRDRDQIEREVNRWFAEFGDKDPRFQRAVAAALASRVFSEKEPLVAEGQREKRRRERS